MCKLALRVCLTVVVLQVLATAGHAAQYAVFDPQGSVATFAVAVNDDKVAAGITPIRQARFTVFCGWQNGNITSFDVAGSTGTSALAINGEEKIAGYYTNTANANHGFFRGDDGMVTTFDVSGASGTIARAINSVGAIAGDYTDAANASHGFLRVSAASLPHLTSRARQARSESRSIITTL